MTKCSLGWGWQGNDQIHAGDRSLGGWLWFPWAASLTDASLRRIDNGQWRGGWRRREQRRR
jgi:hypothetical protein